MNMAEDMYVGDLPAHFQRSCAKDISSSTLSLRNDVAHVLKALAARVNDSSEVDVGLRRDMNIVESSENDQVMVGNDIVLADLQEKLVVLQETLSEMDEIKDFSKIEECRVNILNDKFWESILTLECILQFLSIHFMRLNHAPQDRYESTSGTPLSCLYLVKVSNLCDYFVDCINRIQLRDCRSIFLNELPKPPHLLPSDENIFLTKADQEWKKMFKDSPDVIMTYKLIVVLIRVKRVQLRMSVISTHISQITRSPFCGVRYGTGDAVVQLSKCGESRSHAVIESMSRLLGLEGVTERACDIEDPHMRAKVELLDSFLYLSKELRNETLFVDALAYSSYSPLLFDLHFLGGHGIKLPKEVCSSKSVSPADCVNCSSPTEYIEYNRSVDLLRSISIDETDSSDEELRTFICDSTARCLYIFDTIIKSLATAETNLAAKSKNGPDVCKIAYACLKLLESLEAGTCVWQVCSKAVYPKVTISDVVSHIEGNSGNNARDYGYLSSIERQNFLDSIREISLSWKSPDEDLSTFVISAISLRVQNYFGVDSSASKFKLSHLAMTHSCNLSEKSNVLDFNAEERSPNPLLNHTFYMESNRDCTLDGALSSAMNATHSSYRFTGKESRQEIALLNILEVARSAISFGSDLSVQAYECYARLQHIRHGSTSRLSSSCWSHYEKIAVLASRVHRPERAIWHCETLLNRNTFFGEDINFQKVYRIVKILVSQYSTVSHFDKARELIKRYHDLLGNKSSITTESIDIEARIKFKNMYNDLTVSLARVNLLDGCPDSCAHILQEFLQEKGLFDELGEGDMTVDISESAMALLAKAYLDMDDVVRATRIIMVMKHVRTERKAARALLKKQLLARGGKLPFKTNYQRPFKGASRCEGTISSLSSNSEVPNLSDNQNFEMHINADSGAFDEFYLSSNADLMLTHIPFFCMPDLNVDMGALQAVTQMKSKAYENALHSMVPTIIGVEQTIMQSNFPVDGVLELANIYLLRGQISFEASTRCANIEFPFKVEAMNTYSIIRQLMTESNNTVTNQISDFGYGHQDCQYSSPSDLLRDAMKWFERSQRMFVKANSSSCISLSAYWIAQCHLEPIFVPAAILGVPLAKAKDVSPPLMKSVGNLDVVHKLDVKSNMDIGGLFTTDLGGSLGSDSIGGSTISGEKPFDMERPKYADQGDDEIADNDHMLSTIESQSSDAHHVSIRTAAKVIRYAMTSAVKSRNVPLMINLYLSTAELKFVKGDKVGAISSWVQARNFFFRMLVVGKSIPIARRASLPHLRTIERQLNRLVRFLWVCDKPLINANIALFDIQLNFTMDLDRAVRQNVLISHRLSFDLNPLLAKLDNQYEVVKLAEFEQTDRIKATGAPIDITAGPSDNDLNVDSSSAVGDDLSTHETNDTRTSADGEVSIMETDNCSSETISSAQDNTISSAQDLTSESAGSSIARGGNSTDQGDCILSKITVPLHISMKGQTDTHVASMKTVKKPSRSLHMHTHETTGLQNKDGLAAAKEEALIQRVWGLYLCFARHTSIHQQKSQYSRVMELGLEETFSAISACTMQMTTDDNATGVADMNYDAEQEALLKETLRKVSICAGGADINTILQLPMLTSDRGMRVCKVVYAICSSDLLLMYHPFSGRKHAELFGCADFSSYADANEYLEPKLRTLLINGRSSQHSQEIMYNYPRRPNGDVAGFTLNQISLGSDFSKLVCDLAITSDGAKCSGGPTGRMMIVERLKLGPLNAIACFLKWAADPRLYESLFKKVSGSSSAESAIHGSSDQTYGGINPGIAPAGQGFPRGQGHGLSQGYELSHGNGISRGIGHSVGHLHGPMGGSAYGRATPQQGLSNFTGMLTRGIYSMMDPSTSRGDTIAYTNAPVTLLCSSSLHVLPWELLVSSRDVLLRGLDLLSGTRAFLKDNTTMGPSNGNRPVYISCGLGLSGVPIKLKNDIQKCEKLSRELGVAYCVHRLFSSYVPKRSHWYEQSRRKPPFDLHNTRVPAEIVSKYVNVVNSYWRQDLPTYTPLLPLGKTNSQQLRSKPLRRISFVDISSLLSVDANTDPSELVGLIDLVEDTPMSSDLPTPPNSGSFRVIIFSYADLIDMISSISYVLHTKTEEMVCIFVPHFCMSTLAKEIVKVVDQCYTDALTRNGSTDVRDVSSYPHGSMSSQQHPMPPQPPHLNPNYGGFGPHNYNPGQGFQSSGLKSSSRPWGEVSTHDNYDSEVSMSLGLPGVYHQSWDGDPSQYHMPIPPNPAIHREFTSLALQALINAVTVAEKQHSVYIPIFA